MSDFELDNLRRSERINKGKPPVRYEDQYPKQSPILEKCTSSVKSKKHSSYAASLRTQHLRAELEAERKLTKIKERQELLDLEKRNLEREQKLTKKELELKKLEIESQENLSEDLSRKSNESLKSEERKSNIQKWLNDNDKKFEVSKNETSNYQNDILQKFISRQSIKSELPIFSGNPIDWPNFITQYHESTAICQFSNRENISRLQKCLKGKARDTVEAMLYIPDKLDKIISSLERRFGRPDYVIEQLIYKAKQIGHIKEDKLDLIIDFANAVQNLTITIESLNCRGYLLNPQLIKELVDKLPVNLKIQWGHRAKSQPIGQVDMTIFSEWLEEIADSTAYVTTPRFDEENKKKNYEKTLLSTNENKKKCECCHKDGHLTLECKSFLNKNVEDRWNWITSKKMCFACLKSGHQLQQCLKRRKCNKEECQRYHHPLLHKTENSIKSKNEEKQPTLHTTIISKKQVLLRVAPVILKSATKEIQTYALFDEASTVTLIDEDISNKLNLKGMIDPLCIQWTNETTKCEELSRKVCLKISGIEQGQKIFTLNGVRTVKKLSLPTQTINIEKVAAKWPYIKKVNIKNMENAKPTILIGQDNWPLTVAREIIHGCWRGPVLTKTWLGWVIHGNIPENQSTEEVVLTICHHDGPDKDNDLYQLVKDSFSTESFGVSTRCSPASQEELDAKKIIDDTTRRIGQDRWETGLLWKRNILTLQESKSNAFRRLKCIETKMDKDPIFANAYCEKIEDYLTKGYARKLSRTESANESPKTWYLPHFAVVNVNKPGKIRIVFDAAAKSHGQSLNDALLKGPDLLNSLPGVIWKFRKCKIGFGADIKEMFPQVKIRQDDLPAQRFLWRGKRRDGFPDTYEMTSMIFGAVCSPCSAQEVKNRNAIEFQTKYPEAANSIIKKHYMDDYLDSKDTVEEAITLIRQVIEVHQRGGFVICNWICSSREVLEQIPRELRTAGNKDLNIETELLTERVLGLWWDPNYDVFKFILKFHKIHVEIIEGRKIPTKREILKMMMSIFDPLGFLANYIVHAKILLQDIWKSEIGWDDSITNEMNNRWQTWTNHLKSVEKLSIPRCYSPIYSSATSIQLHIFCDASEKAFATVAYFRIKKGNILNISFVTAKTRVAPLKSLSIPRLELQAAVMASRLAQTIQQEHDIIIQKIIFWSDSKTVLYWIRSNTQKYKQFVAHRIGEILELTNMDEWKWVPTKENIADAATKWTKSPEFIQESRWFQGPKFLQLSEYEWPTEMQNTSCEEICFEKKEFVAVSVTTRFLPLPDIERFSKWSKLIRSTAWLLRFINKSRRKHVATNFQELELAEIEAAEKLWWTQVQWDSFPNEMSRLENKKNIEKSSRLVQCSPILDGNGIMRLKGRINSSYVHESVKQPIILEPKHKYTKLLINYYHEKFNHHGQEMVVNELRQKYYILQIRTAVRSAWNSCQYCKITRSKPQIQEMRPLPEVRVNGLVRPFTYTSVDYFGPLEVTVGRHREKRYGVLFICLTIKAIHLEIASSLSTDSAIMAIRRMAARRGAPREMYSDNGTNFRGADTELRNELNNLNKDKIMQKLTLMGIKWHFIPPAAPHMSGIWERLIRSVKTSMKTILKEQAPKEECLQTVFVEIENIVNSRPLTFVSTDPDDLESLTPNHFIFGTSHNENFESTLTQSMLTCGTQDDKFLRRQWRIARQLADRFWRRWIKEYLPAMTKRTKWYIPSQNLKTGDIVFIIDNNAPRNSWLRGIISEVFAGSDGKIRVADVKTKSGIFRRPITKLCVIDTNST